MDKDALMQGWRAHGKRLQNAVELAVSTGRPKAGLEAAAELNRFLDHPRDLMRLDAEADRHLSARNAQGEWRVNGYDRVALQAHRERLANEHQWFMEYKQESGISPVYPAKVSHGAQVSELSEDGRSVIMRWDTRTLPGLIRQGWEDLKSEAPQVVQSIRQTWVDRGPSDRTLYELCVSLNRTAVGALGGFTAPITRAGVAGHLSNDVWGEAAGMAAQKPIEQKCRLAIPRSAPSLADWHRQVIGAAPEGHGLQIHEGEAVAHVDVPATWFASHAVADELATRTAHGQLLPQEAQTVLQQVTEPKTGMAGIWPDLLAQQAQRERAASQNLQEHTHTAADMSGRAWVADSPMLSPVQKANFHELVNHFETPLSQLTAQDRRLSEQVMALHYVDEVSVHGGMDESVAAKLAALNRAVHAPSGQAATIQAPSGGVLHLEPQHWPDGLSAHRQALNQALAPVLEGKEGHDQWTHEQTQRLQAYALRTTVHHHLGPDFNGAWLSHDGQRVGVLDSVGVLRDFAVADAMKQSPQQSWSDAASSWEAVAHGATVARATGKDRAVSEVSRSSGANAAEPRSAESVSQS
ncbi:hypothetical protein [Hydrogenophaga sp.]|uniref:hypothetical protein n=1 Tax=Hydrogenophaga sp. TaxID=1904254 RepID=UPI002717E1FC|nr:hypothetical protein [Hydrogenophaga sp.]MDO8906041.1 hypothetical protein [Hydrogenophaga sp.]